MMLGACRPSGKHGKDPSVMRQNSRGEVRITLGDRPSRLRRILNFVGRMFGRKPSAPPADPYAYIMPPVRRGPGGRSGAAVAEIEDDSFESFPPRRS